MPKQKRPRYYLSLPMWIAALALGAGLMLLTLDGQGAQATTLEEGLGPVVTVEQL